ncbi:ribonuclease HII [Alkalicoccobacillus porphyridii]|uniref:Ribonuclease HII n=1 Tax=Alkalicoccobacillus porphyridii TaxID=2597270 RepID=A0A553ZY73_9BACI|nr:ribonuclease HII [Alkalicoccobacillus porphyridii]TSB46392.1 ribonuclease HII [Alkalicoccobacillus porphyridii]
MTIRSIRDIKEDLLQCSELERDKQLKALQHDTRKGVQALVSQWKAKQEKANLLAQQYVTMQQYERELKEQGFQAIAGIDEAGRGPLAGPVVAAAVILPNEASLLGLTDSKQLSKKKREYFYDEIKRQAVAYSIQAIDAQMIDSINIYQATKVAMQRAVEDLSFKADYLLLDAMNLPIEVEQTSLVKGDQKSLSIAAASVLAKVWRDQYMCRLSERYPEYGFSNHSGYGTPVHLEAMKQHGITSEHRRSFEPVKAFI